LLEKAWERTLAGETRVRPWPWADTWPVARLKAPRLSRDLIVLAGGGGRTLAFGPGSLDGSSAPGQPGNSVISGHRDTHFRFLQHLALGDRITIQTPNGGEQAYRVFETRVVNAATTRLSAGGVEPVLTLATCYPFDALIPGGPLRYLVTAEAL